MESFVAQPLAACSVERGDLAEAVVKERAYLAGMITVADLVAVGYNVVTCGHMDGDVFVPPSGIRAVAAHFDPHRLCVAVDGPDSCQVSLR